MLLFSKVTKLFLKKFISFCLPYGKLCFLCVTVSTIITVILLWEKIEVNSNKNITTVWNNSPQLIKNQKEKQGMQYQQTGIFAPTITSKKVTKSLSEMIKIIPEVNEDIVFFNSIPRSGGELIVLLLQWLKDLNGFRHVRLPGGSKHKLRRYEQEKLIQAMMNNVRDGAVPFTFDNHVFFINFTSFGYQLPTYINFIRDPIDKAIARFYYEQVTPTPAYTTAKNNLGKEIQLLSTPSWKTKLHNAVVKEFERCVKRDEPRCTYQDGSIHDLTIPYFCGHDKSCMMMNNRWALNKAKETVERYYSVVGVLEEVNATLAVLQHRLPYFFRGVLDVFNLQLSETKKKRALNHPVNVLDIETKKKLESQLSTEYEFYNFIRSRLLVHYAEAAQELHL